MRIEELRGKLVLLRLADEITEDYKLFQIYGVNLWALATEVESEGLWIENPKYELGFWLDEEGNIIPPEKQKKEELRAEILIPWRFIEGLMTVHDTRFQRVKVERLPGFKSYK